MENKGSITVSQYLNKFGLLDDCIRWMKLHYPNKRRSNNTNRKKKKTRTIVAYVEHCKIKLSMGKGYCDDSPKLMGKTSTDIINKNMMFTIHLTGDRFLNIRELMHLMGYPTPSRWRTPSGTKTMSARMSPWTQMPPGRSHPGPL